MAAVIGDVLRAGIGVLKEDRCCTVAVKNDTSILSLENPAVSLKHGTQWKTKTTERDSVGPNEDRLLFEFHREPSSGPRGLVTFRVNRGGNKLCYLVIYFFVPFNAAMKSNEYNIVIVDDPSSDDKLYKYLKNNRVKVSRQITPTRIEFDDKDAKFVVNARMDSCINAELLIKVCNATDAVLDEGFFEVGRAVDHIPESNQTYVVNLSNQAVWVNVGDDKMPLPEVSAPAGVDDVHDNEKQQVNWKIFNDKGCTKVEPETIILFSKPTSKVKRALRRNKTYFSVVAEDGTVIIDDCEHELGGYVIINKYDKEYFVTEKRAGLKQALNNKPHLNFAEIRKILTSKAPQEENPQTPIKRSTATSITPNTPSKRRLNQESDATPPSKIPRV